jgi:hypothetical protein
MKPKIFLSIRKEKVVEVKTLPDVIVEIFDYDTSKYNEHVLEEDANKRLCKRTRYLQQGTRYDEEAVRVAILNGHVAKVIIPKNLGILIEVRYEDGKKVEEFQ